jgi:hypothetical protein
MGLGLEVRTSHLQSRRSTTGDTLPALFALVVVIIIIIIIIGTGV